MLSIYRAIDASDAFAAWGASPEFSAIDAHPVTGAFGQQYYPAVFGNTRQDESFAVVERGEPQLLVLCTIGDGRLDYFGFPIKIFVRSGLAPPQAAVCVSAAFAHFDDLSKQSEVRHIVVRDDGSHGTLSLIGKQCLNRNFGAAVRLSALCDLTEGEPGMKRGLRKRFQSYLNWGRRNLTMLFVNASNADRGLFAQYQEFHCRVAGRSTRPQASWDVMFERIASGAGELSLGSLADGDVVSGTMVVDGTSVAYYASGVYDRDRFDLPLAHWPFWLAMSRSAERGLRMFDIGDVPLEGAATKKEVDIGYFKRGFATTIATGIIWKLDLNGRSGER